MASSSAKKTVLRNKVLLKNLAFWEVVVSFTFVVLSTLKSMSLSGMLARSAPEMFGIYFLYRISRPKYVSHNKAQRLEDCGTSLESRGVVSLWFDFVYLSWAAKVLSIFSGWAYLLYLILLLSVIYTFAPSFLGIKKILRP